MATSYFTVTFSREDPRSVDPETFWRILRENLAFADCMIAVTPTSPIGYPTGEEITGISRNLIGENDPWEQRPPVMPPGFEDGIREGGNRP